MLELGSSGLFTLQSPDHPLSVELRRVANRLEIVELPTTLAHLPR
jgi:hypothetical protein